MLFSAWQATRQALQPVHWLRSMTIAHWCFSSNKCGRENEPVSRSRPTGLYIEMFSGMCASSPSLAAKPGLLVARQAALAHNRPAFHRAVLLGQRQQCIRPRPSRFCRDLKKGSRQAAQRVHIEAGAMADAHRQLRLVRPVPALAITQRQRDHVVRMAECHQHRQFNRNPLDRQAHHRRGLIAVAHRLEALVLVAEPARLRGVHAEASAVAGDIRAALSQVSLVIGSGASCIQALLT